VNTQLSDKTCPSHLVVLKMPITIKPSLHGANLVDFEYQTPAKNAQEVLEGACPSESRDCYELLQTSFDSKFPESIIPSGNGFVHSIIEAYNQHHHISIRPDDVWFSILTQLSVYINKHAEDLRGQFVTHKGKRELKIVYEDETRYSADFGKFANDMGHLLEENILDKELRDWILPMFSTTTPHDTVIASILMMGAMQKYFGYGYATSCGLPSVTLLGSKTDWKLILTRLDKIKTWGQEPTQFHDLLKPVISRFVRTFDDPASAEIIEFWQQVVSEHHQGSGSSFYDGWITAFCFWGEDGTCKYDREVFMWDPLPDLILDGVRYHKVDIDGVPPGWTAVPVKVEDNGYIFNATMVAGSVGIKCASSREAGEEGMVEADSMSPQAGWFMFERKKGVGKRRGRKT
jgi:Domain of unknown function (DUF4419)